MLDAGTRRDRARPGRRRSTRSARPRGPCWSRRGRCACAATPPTTRATTSPRRGRGLLGPGSRCPKFRDSLAARLGPAPASTPSRPSSTPSSRRASRSPSPSRGRARPGMEADLFAPAPAPFPWQARARPAPESLTMAQALNRGLRKILAERPESHRPRPGHRHLRRRLQGDRGPAARTSAAPRVFNTPLAESACTGYAIGLALNGHRPIEEFQFADFATEAMTQITLNAATMHFRSGAACPLVLRLPCGGGLTFGSFHSQELESFFLSMPGLKALYPSTRRTPSTPSSPPTRTTTRCCSSSTRASTAAASTRSPGTRTTATSGTPRRVRDGRLRDLRHLRRDGPPRRRGLRLPRRRIRDRRSSSSTCAASPRSSSRRSRPRSRARGRLIVLHEGRSTHGFGAELVARLTEEHFAPLKAPPLRIGVARPAGALRPRARGGLPADQGRGHRADHGVDAVKRKAITRAAWAPIRLFAMDVDGVLTDGTVIDLLGRHGDQALLDHRRAGARSSLRDRALDLAWISRAEVRRDRRCAPRS